VGTRPVARRTQTVDSRLKLFYFLALASSLVFAKSTLRLAILVVLFTSFLILFRRTCLRRPHALLSLLFVAGSVFALHCFFAMDGSSYGQFSAIGCQRGARLALTIVSLWAAAALLFSSAKPLELTRAIGCILPYASRPGSFSHSFVSLVSMGLLIFPTCKTSLAAARTAEKARGGSLGLKSPGQSRRNLEKLTGFALRRLYLASDDIHGRLASKGYSGPKVRLKRGATAPIRASDILLFAAATTLTVAILLV